MSSPESAMAAELPSTVTGAAGGSDPGQPSDLTTAAQATRSLAADAWFDLRRSPIFWIAGVIVLAVVTIAIFPGWFASADPRS